VSARAKTWVLIAAAVVVLVLCCGLAACLPASPGYHVVHSDTSKSKKSKPKTVKVKSRKR